jgi:hypothetical protein
MDKPVAVGVVAVGVVGVGVLLPPPHAAATTSAAMMDGAKYCIRASSQLRLTVYESEVFKIVQRVTGGYS